MIIAPANGATRAAIIVGTKMNAMPEMIRDLGDCIDLPQELLAYERIIKEIGVY